MRLVRWDPALRCPHPPASAQLWEARLGQQLFLTASFGDHTDEIQWPASAQQACGASSTSFRGFCSVFFPVIELEEPLPFVHFSDRSQCVHFLYGGMEARAISGAKATTQIDMI